jgi:DNA-binding MarR family transcriptional regulator
MSTDRASRAERSPTAFTFGPTVSIPAVLDGAVGTDRAFRRLLYDISVAAAHIESAREYLAGRLGVTSPQYNMLMVIARNERPTGISVSDVASHLHVSNTFVTTEIKKLVRSGLVAKEPNPADARSVLLRLTPQGVARVKALEPDLLFVNDRLFEHISKQDFGHLSRIVSGLIGDFARTVAILKAMADGSRQSDVSPLPARR